MLYNIICREQNLLGQNKKIFVTNSNRICDDVVVIIANKKPSESANLRRALFEERETV